MVFCSVLLWDGVLTCPFWLHSKLYSFKGNIWLTLWSKCYLLIWISHFHIPTQSCVYNIHSAWGVKDEYIFKVKTQIWKGIKGFQVFHKLKYQNITFMVFIIITYYSYLLNHSIYLIFFFKLVFDSSKNYFEMYVFISSILSHLNCLNKLVMCIK